MIKEVLIGAAVLAIIVAAIAALIKYLKEQQELGITPERVFFDDLNLNEIKGWYKGKIDSEDKVGVLLYPNKENLEKWKLNIEENDHMIIQMVYNKTADEVVSYREIAFTEMSSKLKEMLDNSGGSVVIEK